MFAHFDRPARYGWIARLDLPRLILVVWISHGAARGADWKPAGGPLMTRWANDVSPERAHPEGDRLGHFDGLILVPFPVESALSGVMWRVRPEQKLWYRRSFSVPKFPRGKRILLLTGS
jgi:hypothetical protein